MRSVLSTTSGGFVLRGRRIVVPRGLQDLVVKLAHHYHQGTAKTKARLREKLWFQGMDTKVEALVVQCLHCQLQSEGERPAPVITEDASTVPWTKVSIEFGSFPDGRRTRVFIGAYSKYPVVEIIKSTAFKHIKPKVEKTFPTFGLPNTLRSDNGPPFHRQKFQSYLKNIKMAHRRITPRWPQDNGNVERIM